MHCFKSAAPDAASQSARAHEELRQTDRLFFLAGAILIAAYFLGLTWPSLGVYFSGDDMMNLDRSWSLPLGMLPKANLLFFWASPYIRPLPSVWYRTIFHFAGLNPYPFHATYVAMFLVNLAITYFLSRRLSGSAEVAAVATLLDSYWHRMDALYFDTGYIYDTLCYCFYYGALLFYVRARERNRLLRPWQLVVLCLLYVSALDSKEMAVTLPAVFLIYELLYVPQPVWNGSGGRWIVREGRGILATGLITVIFVIGRIQPTPESLWSQPLYRPAFTWSRFMETSGHFFGEILGRRGDWAPVTVLLLWAALLGMALVLRSQTLQFAWLLVMLSPLPIAFIVPRPAPLYYIPWFGWSLYAAVAVVKPVQCLTRRLWTNEIWQPRIRGAGLVLAMVATLFPYFRSKGWDDVTSVTQGGPINHALVEQLHPLVPQFPRRSRIYFLNDPFPPDTYDLLFIVHLSYLDDSLIIDRAKSTAHPLSQTNLASYDYVFDYQPGRLLKIKPSSQFPTAPTASQVR